MQNLFLAWTFAVLAVQCRNLSNPIELATFGGIWAVGSALMAVLAWRDWCPPDRVRSRRRRLVRQLGRLVAGAVLVITGSRLEGL